MCLLVSTSSCGKKQKGKQIDVTIEITCSQILEHMEDFNKDKEKYLPEDGWIFKKKHVKMNEGDSVFDVLKKICKENKIHIESSTSPVYKSVYVEGINQLYEFDCGPQSGWMYKVNEEIPNYGCSAYKIKDGDDIVWYYTVTLGDFK